MMQIHTHHDNLKVARTAPLDAGDYLMPIPETCLAEVDTVLHEIRANPRPATVYTPGLPSLRGEGEGRARRRRGGAGGPPQRCPYHQCPKGDSI